MKKAPVGFTEAFFADRNPDNLLQHKQLATDMARMQVTTIFKNISPGIKQIAGRNTDILSFPWFEHDLGMQDGRCRLIHGGAELEPVLSRCIIRHF
jgi:hypothetical protein